MASAVVWSGRSAKAAATAIRAVARSPEARSARALSTSSVTRSSGVVATAILRSSSSGEVGVRALRGVDLRQADEDILVGEVDRGCLLEGLDGLLPGVGVRQPEAGRVVPGIELVRRDEAQARDRLVRLGGACGVARGVPHLGEKPVRDEVARVLGGRLLETGEGGRQVVLPERGLREAEPERRHLHGPGRALEQLLRHADEERVVLPRACVRVQEAEGREGGDGVRRRELRELERRVPVPFGAATAEPRSQVRVGHALAAVALPGFLPGGR